MTTDVAHLTDEFRERLEDSFSHDPKMGEAVYSSIVSRAEREHARGRFCSPGEIQSLIDQFEAGAAKQLQAAREEVEEAERLLAKHGDLGKRLNIARRNFTNIQDSIEHRKNRLLKYLHEAKNAEPSMLERVKRLFIRR